MNTKDIIANNQQELQKLPLAQRDAGKLVTSFIHLASDTETIADVRQRLFESSSAFNSNNDVYVIDKERKLVGVFPIIESLRLDPMTPIKKIMQTDLIVGHPHSDREHIAHLALKNNIKAVPIVDKDSRFLGIVPSDQILRTLYQELREDFLKAAGIVPQSETFEDQLSMNTLTSFIHRLPWILLGLFGGMAAARIVGIFEHTLTENLILAAFIPLIVYMSDAVGTQTQTLFIRDLAFNCHLPIVRYTLKQTYISALIAAICGVATWLMVFIFWHESYLGIVIGVATTISILLSTFIAIAIPYLLHLFKQDPADGSGPFATVLQDIFSIIIYFLIATAMF